MNDFWFGENIIDIKTL